MHQALEIIFVIVGVLAIGFWWEARRRKSLEAWVLQRPGARFLSPLVLDEHAGVPLAEMVEALMGRLPMGWAGAVQIAEAEGELWLAEFRTTLPGDESTSWLTLIARRCLDERAALACLDSMQRLRPDVPTRVLGRWVYQRRKGLITVAVLDSIVRSH